MSILRIASSCMIIVTVLDTSSAYGSFHGVSMADKAKPQAPSPRQPYRPSAAHCPGWRTCSNIPATLAHQILVAMTLAEMSEALVYKAKMGIDPALLAAAMRSSVVWRSAIIKMWRKCNNGLLLPIE